jgi:hypothetical protein
MKVLCKDVLRKSPPVVHWKLACTPLLDEVIHRSGVKVGAPDCCQILGFKETRENTGWVFAFTAHTLTATDWLAALIGSRVVFSVYNICYLQVVGGDGKTFNTKFGCENMACRPFSSEPLEMLLTTNDKIRSGFYV